MEGSIRIQGRDLSAGEIDYIRGLIASHPDWSRRRLSQRLCQAWDWRNGSGVLKDTCARDTRNTAACQCRRQQPARHDQEEVAHRTLDQAAVRIQHEALPERRIIPFRPRQHLLQPVEVLDAGQRRIAGQPRAAEPYRHRRGWAAATVTSTTSIILSI